MGMTEHLAKSANAPIVFRYHRRADCHFHWPRSNHDMERSSQAISRTLRNSLPASLTPAYRNYRALGRAASGAVEAPRAPRC